MNFKLHMVELASKPNANVAELAREHGVDNNLIFLMATPLAKRRTYFS